ncbi:hypothetical protein ACH429_14385 [Streptomyces pathocidini]|uniref:Uncharacterized protein n=1 Tax=Streptomyces pathocidini TaxID=1650571 RepID=A0ABW7URM6_9ACTN|nr:WXG100 family type VII secretion target [Streptomyces pathocidini]
MAVNPYPHLGWNPVPGIPGEVDALQQKVTAAAASLRNCHSQLQRLIGESSYWEGDAAKAFREALDGELPTYIKNAARSLEKASAQLKVWDGDLTSHRDLARKYDDEAGDRKAAADKAKQRHAEAQQHPDLKLADKQYPSQEEADAATARLRAAESSLNEAATALERADSQYNDIIRKAEMLEHSHADQAETVARALDGATDKLAPREPGWLSKAVNTIWEGVKKGLELLAEHAGTIGSIAGLLALFPTPLTPVFAGIALAASVVSMGKNLSDPEFRSALAGDKFGWNMDTFSAYASVAGDLVGMAPGVGALGRAGKEVAEAAVTAERWGVAASRSEKVAEFSKEFAHVVGRKASEAANEGASAFAAGGREAAKRLGDIGTNGVNVGANLISSGESLGVVPKEGALHNAAESTKAAATAHGILGLAGVL